MKRLERREAWHGALSVAEAVRVADVAGPEMAAFGYLPAAPACGSRHVPGARRLAARLARMRDLESLPAVSAPRPSYRAGDR
ncbi:hypothetical protein [Sphaerimonospora thailandensis]|uniref:Uncharacterized protein n=1 Tax=Sphaerimonospora thailandensis TaxID=795644 RepID=A0A8J3R8L4_9ACTN|nr:hypothetical protein [Sphaerimonospora thailandensis]GIH70478.1 hypothetical protein Mth01_27310 [Sphaerimonospora thailandensis]